MAAKSDVSLKKEHLKEAKAEAKEKIAAVKTARKSLSKAEDTLKKIKMRRNSMKAMKAMKPRRQRQVGL